MQIFEDIQPNIKANKIHQLERTHGMIQAQLQRLVDIFRRGDSRFQHVEGFIPNQRVDARSDKPRRFVDQYNFFAHAPRHFSARGHGFVGSVWSAHQLD